MDRAYGRFLRTRSGGVTEYRLTKLQDGPGGGYAIPAPPFYGPVSLQWVRSCPVHASSSVITYVNTNNGRSWVAADDGAGGTKWVETGRSAVRIGSYAEVATNGCTVRSRVGSLARISIIGSMRGNDLEIGGGGTSGSEHSKPSSRASQWRLRALEPGSSHGARVYDNLRR